MKYDDELQSGFGKYQAYPFYPFLPWEDEKTRDQRRFRELYPMLARRIQPLVEKACDMQEYEGSFMFDEYPDQLMIRRVSRSIYERLDKSAYQDDLMMQEVKIMASASNTGFVRFIALTPFPCIPAVRR